MAQRHDRLKRFNFATVIFSCSLIAQLTGKRSVSGPDGGLVAGMPEGPRAQLLLQERR